MGWSDGGSGKSAKLGIVRRWGLSFCGRLFGLGICSCVLLPRLIAGDRPLAALAGWLKERKPDSMNLMSVR
ncbi:hypothetical protein PanWU01x14_198550 [Parasponia andersonii]|uniref:Transmembrane protein n=1 Tax=Parasponia andersonii TaxID=3476 RepID=A0A2P5BYW0_PARAD|nr:hypothetical protein PanWU01x14_198550 [Parasponia andersonii]